MNGTTTIVTEALGAVPNRIRIPTTAEAARLLEELGAGYQRLGREEGQKIKSLVQTFSKSNGDSL